MNRRDSGENIKPLVKSKIIVYIILPILIIFDCLLFYAYLFIDPIMLNNRAVIDKAIVGQLALITLCWIGTIINLKQHKKNT